MEILAKKDIYITKLIQTNDGFVVLTSGDNEMDSIFNNKTDKVLMEKKIHSTDSSSIKS